MGGGRNKGKGGKLLEQREGPQASDTAYRGGEGGRPGPKDASRRALCEQNVARTPPWGARGASFVLAGSKNTHLVGGGVEGLRDTASSKLFSSTGIESLERGWTKVDIV